MSYSSNLTPSLGTTYAAGVALKSKKKKKKKKGILLLCYKFLDPYLFFNLLFIFFALVLINFYCKYLLRHFFPQDTLLNVFLDQQCSGYLYILQTSHPLKIFFLLNCYYSFILRISIKVIPENISFVSTEIHVLYILNISLYYTMPSL